MSDELDGAVVVEFPLRGEWIAVTSPGDRVPSHGVDMLAQRYAYDFIRTDRRRGLNVHPGSAWPTNIIGGRTRECYAWGQPMHMPFDGEVVAALDGYPERTWVLPIRELALALKNALTFNPTRGLQPVVGNFVVARSNDGVFAARSSGGLVTPATRRRRTCTSSSWMGLTRSPPAACRAHSASSRSSGTGDGSAFATSFRDARTGSGQARQYYSLDLDRARLTSAP